MNPEIELDFFKAVQRAFYVDNKDMDLRRLSQQ
jgi:protein-disulfide isomerase-like protein with CxxC motif